MSPPLATVASALSSDLAQGAAIALPVLAVAYVGHRRFYLDRLPPEDRAWLRSVRNTRSSRKRRWGERLLTLVLLAFGVGGEDTLRWAPLWALVLASAGTMTLLMLSVGRYSLRLHREEPEIWRITERTGTGARAGLPRLSMLAVTLLPLIPAALFLWYLSRR